MNQTHLKSIKKSRILLSPLNWGLGHVSRTIPIIYYLLEQKNEVIICCDESQEQFYRTYFPELWYIPHEGYPFEFQGKGRWTLDILKNIFSLSRFLSEERGRAEELVEKFNPDFIISDQRFGFYSTKVKSIIISHQVNLPVPKWNFIARLWNKRLLSAFDELWIPDTETQAISGELSKGKHKNKKFIGPCSRFSINDAFKNEATEIKYDYLGIVSGPQPYNQQLFDLLVEKMGASSKRSAIIIPGEIEVKQPNSTITIYSQANREEFVRLLLESETIISRMGYTTLMDLSFLNKKAILIPTPGQVEQLYLAGYHKDNKKWRVLLETEWASFKL